MRHAIVSVSALALSALSFATAVRAAEPHYVLPPQAVMADPRFVPPAPPVIQCAATEDVCTCPQTAAAPSSAGPMIISYGPPPSAYSPSADFRTRVMSTPGWAASGESFVASQPQAIYLPPPPYPTYAPAYAGPPPINNWNTELPPPPFEDLSVPQAVTVQERIAIRERPAFVRTVPVNPGRTIAWSAPLCNCPNGTAACGTGSNCDCKVAYSTASNPACSTSCGHDCPCGAACQCGTACDCGGNCACSTNAAKACSTCTSQCSTESTCGTVGRIDHILEAAHHLEAAGMQADADALRRKCDAEMKSVVERLKKAEAEVAALKSASLTSTSNCTASCEGCPNAPAKGCSDTCSPATMAKQILLHVEMVEVDCTKCRELGLETCADPLNYPGIPRPEVRFGVVGNAESLQANMETAKKAGLVKVICHPTITTVAGRPAQAMIGEEVPFPNDSGSIEYKFVGTEVNVVPQFMANGKLRVELRCSHSESDPERKFEVRGLQVAALNKAQVDTGLEVASGETAAITGLQTKHRNATDASEVQLMVFVRPEVVEPITAQVRTSSWTLPFESCDAIDYGSVVAVKPTSCDEGPVFTTCSAFKKCECGPCDSSGACGSLNLFNTKNAFPEPASYDPFEPKMIEMPAIQFDLPGTLPAAPQPEEDFHAEAKPREFIPHMAKPMWLTRPVVAPVSYEEPVRE